MFTLGKIQLGYPNFIHNDLFLRNVLATVVNEYEPTDYVEYDYNGKKYYLPANGIYIKINDFGYTLNILKHNSTLENEIKQSSNNLFEIKNNLRDVYTFLFDLYDGSGMGGDSVKTIITNQIKDTNHKKLLMSSFKKQIGVFLNYKIIDKIQLLNESLFGIWNISNSKILMDTIKTPNQYFKKNVFMSLMKFTRNGRYYGSPHIYK
jgi:hypothetical protein